MNPARVSLLLARAIAHERARALADADLMPSTKRQRAECRGRLALLDDEIEARHAARLARAERIAAIVLLILLTGTFYTLLHITK